MEPVIPAKAGIQHITDFANNLDPGFRRGDDVFFNKLMSEDRRIERIRWRCRRGLLELDVVLKDFLERRYAGLAPAEQDAFEKLLALSDETLFAYVQGSQNPPEKELMQLIVKIRE